MPILTVCKKFTFEAAHFLPNHLGACKNIHGHGFKLEVEVKMSETSHRDMVIDFSDLKRIVNENIIDKVDHSFLNDVFPDIAPTAENLLRRFADLLKGKFFDHNCWLVRMRLHETENSFAEWRSE